MKLKRFDVPFVKILLSCWEDDDPEHFDLYDWTDIQIQSLLMIKLFKIKEYKETWNQASGVQVRGGLLGYKVQGTFVFQSTAVSKCCLKNQNQSTAAYWRLFKVLRREQGLKCNINEGIIM